MKTLYIVDANVAVKWFVPEIHKEAARRQSDYVLCHLRFRLIHFNNKETLMYQSLSSISWNGQELQTILEPLIRKIVQEELTKKLARTLTQVDKLEREHILLNTSVWSEEEVSAIEQVQQELKEWPVETF